MRKVSPEKRQRDEHVAVLTGNGFTVAEVETLITHAKALSTIAERFCCEEMTDTVRKRVEARESSLEEAIRRIVATRNVREGMNTRVSVRFDGDPRGYVVKLLLPDERYNTWGGKETGWGI